MKSNSMEVIDCKKLENEFKIRLADLLDNFHVFIYSDCDGDTHGVYNKRITFMMRGTEFSLLSGSNADDIRNNLVEK